MIAAIARDRKAKTSTDKAEIGKNRLNSCISWRSDAKANC